MNALGHPMRESAAERVARRSPDPSARWPARLLAAMALVLLPLASAFAASLEVADGVVVKFGQDAGMTVRDSLFTGKGVVFTSLRDDTVGGQTKPTPQTGAPGDWRGLRIDPSAAPQDVLIDRLALRLAGGADGAALELQAHAYDLRALFVSDSVVGIRVTDGGTALFSGLSLVGNQVGMEVDRGATPRIVGSDIHANTLFGIDNRTPASVVVATGNWWGAASGPHDPAGNPGGTGDKVSAGVDYGQPLDAPPLIDCTAAPANGRFTTHVAEVTLALACRNAAQFRVSEDPAFAGALFEAMASSVVFTLSPAPGARAIYVQFRGATGATVDVSLAQPIVYTPNAPTITLDAPAAGATIASNATLSATATDAAGIAKVEFFVDASLLATVTTPPYNTVWDITGVANGPHAIKAVATNVLALTAEDSHTVTVARTGDTTGPTISNVRLADVPLDAGDTVTASGALTFDIADASGVQSAQAKLDGNLLPGGSLAAGKFTVQMNLASVSNGPHTLSLIATDTVGNGTTQMLNIIVDLPAPLAPVLTAPANGSTVKQALVIVSGTAAAGGQVQLHLNGTATEGLLSVNGSGGFAGSVTLPAEGTFTIQADVRTAQGTSPLSAAIQITYAIAAPTVVFTSPPANAVLSAVTDIAASAIDAAGISRVDYLLDGSPLASSSTPPYTYTWDVTTVADGSHTLTAIATNTAGRTGQATRTVIVQQVAPPPPPVLTSYTGVIDSITPATSYGVQPIVISGRAVDRASGQAVSNVTLRIVLAVAGFQRKINVATDGAGAFTFAFVPQPSDAGNYVVSVIHPDETTFPNQGQFTINRVTFTPTRYTLNAARTIPSTIPIKVAASAGTGVTGFRFQVDPSAQPSGSLPPGITIDPGATVNIAAGGEATVNVTFTGSGSIGETGTVFLTGFATDSGSASRGVVRVDYTLTTPTAALFPTPTFIETGVAQGSSVTETLTLENKGVIAATNLRVQLQNSNGTTNVPGWIFLASPGQLDALAVGGKQTVQVTAMPGADVADGIYNFKLHVTSDTAAGGDVQVAVSVTQAGIGHVQFNVADIFTSTLDATGQVIPGLAGAAIRIQNENVLTVLSSATSDAQGKAMVSGLPTGTYIYRASAPNHMDASGRLTVRPGVTTIQNVFLDYNVVTVEFSVTETTIQDHYDITLTATYHTQVPAPVVLIEPLMINLPDMQVGEELTGEITITNYGLVRADNVVFTPPPSDAHFRYEVMGTVPTELPAKTRISLPYKVTALSPLPASSQQLAARKGLSLLQPRAAACTSYSSPMRLNYSFDCANGDRRQGGASSGFARTYGSTCGSGGSGGGGGGGPAGGFGGGTWVTHPGAIPLVPGCTPDCGRGICCVGPGAGAAGGGGSGGNGSGAGGDLPPIKPF